MTSQQKVALVTGSSRGAGKGIALALGSKGYTVYVTGRSKKAGDAALSGTIYETAEQVTDAGGKGIAICCDHGNDEQIKGLFDTIMADQGRLDILVNNAAFISDSLVDSGGFWEKSFDQVNIIDVGLRSAYVASYYAARIMSEQRSGLIVNTSSFGATCYMHSPAYGAQKAGLDKMAFDMAHDLRPYNVASASIWMGMLNTERSQQAAANEPEKYANFAAMAESPQFTGLLIDALATDPGLMDKSGKTFVGAELALEYQITDINGNQPISHREYLGNPLSFSAAVVE